MTIEVTLPDQSVAEFPDDMPQEQIEAAVRKHLGTKGGTEPDAYAPFTGRGVTSPPTIQNPVPITPAPPSQPPTIARIANAVESGTEQGLTRVANQGIDAWNRLTRGERNAIPSITPRKPGESLIPEPALEAGRKALAKTADAVTFSGKSSDENIERVMQEYDRAGLPRPSAEDVRASLPNSAAAEGLSQAAKQTAKGFTTLSGLATLPLFEYKLGRAAILALQAIHTPAEVKNAYNILTDDKATPQQKWDAGGEAFANLAMTGALALHMGVSEFKATHTPEEAAVQFGGGKMTEQAPVPPVIKQAKEAGLTRAAAEAAKTVTGADLNIPKGAAKPDQRLIQLIQEGVQRQDAIDLINGKKTVKEVVSGNFKVTPSRVVGEEQGHDEAFMEGYNQAIERLNEILKGGEINAEGIREDQGQSETPGETVEGSKADSSGDVQQTPSKQPESVVTRGKEPEAKTDMVLTPAVKVGDKIFTGQDSHAGIILEQAKQGVDATEGERGFMADGKFIDRAQAAKVFEEQTGQKPAKPGELHSEDLTNVEAPKSPAQKSTELSNTGAPEKIVAVAVRRPDGKIFSTTQGIHLSLYEEAGMDPVEMTGKQIDEASGYITNTGRFVNQKEAERITGLIPTGEWVSEQNKISKPVSSQKHPNLFAGKATPQILDQPVNKPQPNWRVVVQGAKEGAPGFVQIIDPSQAENAKSPTVESLKAAGHDVPDFSKLPEGNYTWEQAVATLAKKGKKPITTKGFDSLADMSQAGRDVYSAAKATKDEHESVDASHLSVEDRQILAKLGISFNEDRNGNILARYPQKLRVEDLRRSVTKKRDAKNPTETPAAVEAKVQEHVTDVSKTEGMRPAKDIKTELVDRISKAINDAPSESELTPEQSEALADARKWQESRGPRSAKDVAMDVAKKGVKQITIDIPGDGTFTVWNTKEALADLLQRAKRLETTAGKPVAVSRSGISKADREWIEAQKAKQESQPVGAGPGAATRPGAVLATDIGAMESNIPPLEKLADAVKRFPKQPGGGFRERLRQWMDDVGIPAKDFATRALVGVKAATASVVNAFTKLADVTSMDRAVGDWNLADTEGDLAARRFAKAVKRTFPDRSKLRAFSNWINAGGDKELLQRQAALTKDPELKKTYTDALNFGPDEERLGADIKQYFDEMLAEAMRAGALEEGLENYIHRYYPREDDPARQRLEGALNEMRFTKNFSGFKRRFYDSDFEAEQAGLKPEKDAAKRILAYDQGFRKALTARAFVKDRYAATMPDGRPEIDVTGVGVPSRTDAETGKESPYLIKPKSKAGGDSPEDYRGDYVTFDHPAFRRWKWVGQDANGKPILMEGELAVHPDAVKKYRALFERSWFQKNPLGRALLVPSNFVKQTMLALSAFHPVQIGIHAIEHKVNPFKLVDLNTRDPAQAELIKGGLVVSDLGGGSHFSEGVGGSGLFGKLPIAGEMVKASQDWLFKDFIPRIKMTMALDALERNRRKYANNVADGKITDEQLVRLTARESNAAFGEQNYRAMFRHKGFQDVLRFAFLAPDFGEARLRFPLQAITRYGGEQRMAIMLGAIGMFVAAKTAEKLLTGKINVSKPFSVTVNNREYGLRNVASDLVHMITDPAGYLRNRLNPIYTRPVLEMLSGRDAFGRKRSGKQQVLDEVKQIVPISARGAVEKDQTLWESFVNAIGLTEHRSSAFGQAMRDVNAWKGKKGYTAPGEFVYDADKDPYSKLTTALTYGSSGDAAKQLDALTQGKTPAQARKIAEHYRRSLAEHPYLTGSRAHEQEYVSQLSAKDKAQYDEARAERKAMWQKFVKIWRSRYPAPKQ